LQEWKRPREGAPDNRIWSIRVAHRLQSVLRVRGQGFRPTTGLWVLPSVTHVKMQWDS